MTAVRRLSGPAGAAAAWRTAWGPDAPLPLPLLLLAATDTAAVEGISAAGSTPQSRRRTAAADAELLLHGPACTRPGHHFSAAELVGYGKTTHRLLTLLRKHPWVDLQPLEWLSPEELLFHCCNDALLYDLVQLHDHLEQAETLQLHTLEAWTFLAFRRC